MKAAWLYRVAAVVLVLFAALHTVGFMKFRPPTAEGQAVWDAMERVATKAPGTVRNLGWGLFLAQVGSLVLSWIYFSAAPAIFSGVVVVCLGWAAAISRPSA